MVIYVIYTSSVIFYYFLIASLKIKRLLLLWIIFYYLVDSEPSADRLPAECIRRRATQDERWDVPNLRDW